MQWKAMQKFTQNQQQNNKKITVQTWSSKTPWGSPPTRGSPVPIVVAEMRER